MPLAGLVEKATGVDGISQLKAVLVLLLAAAAVAAVWRYDVYRRPWKPCPSCNGRKRTRGSRPKAFGKFTCRRCGGKGEVRRWGAGRERQ